MAEKLKDQADHEAKIAEEAAAVVNQYSNQLEKLKEIEAAIKKRGDSTGKTVALETALKDIYKQQADILIKQNLATGTLQGGLNAFILECESKMKKPGEILYDGLNEAMDKSSDQLAKLFTGQKTDYKTMFKGIGENMMKETTKSLMQEGVGKLGEHFGIKIPGMEAKPDGSETKPFNVKIVGGFAGNSGGSTPFSGGQGIDGLFGGGDQGNGVFSMMQPFSGGQGIDGLMGGGSGQPTGLLSLLKAFSGGGIAGLFGGAGSGVAGATAGAGEMDELASMLGLAGMAEGGEVDPGQSYWVGDRADRMPEVFSPSVPGEITPIDKLGAGGDTHVTYNIDSRGSDIGSWSRVQQGLKATHDTSVVHSAQIQDAKKARVPERKGR